MKIDFEGRVWDYEPDELDVRQAMVLHMTYGLTIKAWNNGFTELDQRCYHFAYWHMLQQAGVVKKIGDCNPRIIDYISAYVDAQQAEAAKAEAEAEPEPVPFPQDGPPSREPLPRKPPRAPHPDRTAS